MDQDDLQPTRDVQTPNGAENLAALAPAPKVDDTVTRKMLPNRYLIKEDDNGRYLTCVEAANVQVRIERGWEVASTTARRYPEGTIFLDGAARGEPFMDVQRRIYNLDHHEDCVRSFTLATCEQAMVVILKGLDLRGGDWNIYANEPDLDTVLAVWAFLNHSRLTASDPRLRRQLMPVVRLEGVIDAHGLELIELCGFSEPVLTQAHQSIENLRHEELHLKSNGRWQTVDELEYTRSVLGAVDELLYTARDFTEYLDIEELARVRISAERMAVVCRTSVGIYEAERYLKKMYGDRVGVIVLQKGSSSTYTVRQTDPFVPTGLDDLYDRLNLLDPNASRTSRWGGSGEIGGSPRGEGSGLSSQEIADACRGVYQPPHLLRRTGTILAATAIAGVAIAAAVVGACGGLPAGPGPGLLAAAGPASNAFFGLLLILTASGLLLLLGWRKARPYGLRWPAGAGWMALLPAVLVVAATGGFFPPLLLAPDLLPASPWAAVVATLAGLTTALGCELLFRGVVHGLLIGHFNVQRHKGSWFLSVPTATAAVLSTLAMVLLYLPAADGPHLLRRLAWCSAGLVLGGLAGLARERWESLLPPLLLHGIAALVVWVVLPLLLAP